MTTFESQQFAAQQRALADEREIEGYDRASAGFAQGAQNFFQTQLAMREMALREQSMQIEEVENMAALQEHQGRMQEMNARLQALSAVSEIDLRRQALRQAKASADLAEFRARAASPEQVAQEREYERETTVIERSIAEGFLKRDAEGRLVETTEEERRRPSRSTVDPNRRRLNSLVPEFLRGDPKMNRILESYERGQMGVDEAAEAIMTDLEQRQSQTNGQAGAVAAPPAQEGGDQDADTPVSAAEVPFRLVFTKYLDGMPPEVQQKWISELLPDISAGLVERKKRNPSTFSRSEFINEWLRAYRERYAEADARRFGIAPVPVEFQNLVNPQRLGR